MTGKARPLSPHLQIYRLPLTALLSVTHRLTGLALSFGAVLLIAILFATVAGPEAYAVAHALAASWPGIIVLVLFTFALYFHLCNGVRHLFWDAGFGFELSTAHASAVATLVVSAAMTGITWLVVLVA